MRAAIVTLALAFAVLTATPASAEGTDWYVGLAGGGIALTQPLTGDFEWGGKAETGYLGKWFGASAQGIVRYNLPVEDVPVYVQLGIGAHVEFGGKLLPWGSLGFGARFGKWNAIIQLPGYPVIGLSFPL